MSGISQRNGFQLGGSNIVLRVLDETGDTVLYRPDAGMGFVKVQAVNIMNQGVGTAQCTLKFTSTFNVNTPTISEVISVEGSDPVPVEISKYIAGDLVLTEDLGLLISSTGLGVGAGDLSATITFVEYN